MAQIIQAYHDLMASGDSRIQNWPMMSSPLPTLSICAAYVCIVKIIGPRLMKNRPAFNLRKLMIVYNFLMVYVSIHLFYKLGIHGWFGKYNYRCQPVDYSDSDDAVGMMTYAYLYYLSKFIELADTLFFVLRKKDSHVSTLHVIHHGIMPMSVWWGAKFTPGGHSTFFAFINSFVHILMYFYYALAAIGPQMNKFLWWKKYMTLVQMVQFIMIFVHSFQLLFRQCDYPRGFMWWIGFHAVLFWFLFYDFFYNSYSQRVARQAKKLAAANGTNGVSSNGKSVDKVHSNGTVKLEENGQAKIANGHSNGSSQLLYRKKNGVAADLLKLRENEAEIDSHQY